MRTIPILLLAAAAAPAAAAPAAAAPVTAIAVPAERPGWFVCDGIDTPVAMLVGARQRDGTSVISFVQKPSGHVVTYRYGVGRGDPGAGQVHYALTSMGREVGNLHQVNPGMIDPPGAASTPTFTSVMLDGKATQCRWLRSTRLNGVTGRRGVSITREGGALVYRTFDFAHPGPIVEVDGVQRMRRPSLEVRGGVEQRTPDGATHFRFANEGYTYVVSVPPGGRDASLAVQRGGRNVQVERFLGVTLAD